MLRWIDRVVGSLTGALILLIFLQDQPNIPAMILGAIIAVLMVAQEIIAAKKQKGGENH